MIKNCHLNRQKHKVFNLHCSQKVKSPFLGKVTDDICTLKSWMKADFFYLIVNIIVTIH